GGTGGSAPSNSATSVAFSEPLPAPARWGDAAPGVGVAKARATVKMARNRFPVGAITPVVYMPGPKGPHYLNLGSALELPAQRHARPQNRNLWVRPVVIAHLRHDGETWCQSHLRVNAHHS